MMDKLIEGAKAAREASVDGMDIEIVLTELGMIVRGKRRHGGRDYSRTHEVVWREFDMAIPNLLSNAVALVSIGLRS